MLSRLPWTPKPEPKAKPKLPRRMNSDRRKHLVSRAAEILKNGQMSAFQYEATCRHGLRAGLCLAGWRWDDADALAADVVSEALRRVGARRPTWLEGQSAAFRDGAEVPREHCLGCGGQLANDTDRFCSRPCKGAWLTRVNDRWLAENVTAGAKARALTRA